MPWTLASVCLALLSAAAPQGLLVSGAVSLSDALYEVAAAYRAAGGAEVRINLAGSNVPARQIVNGAPVDVFISADAAQMEVVASRGLLVPSSRRVIASNQLVVVAQPERAAAVREAFGSAGPAIRRLALGDPAAVPAGVYARQYLERRRLWAAFEGRVVPAVNVRGALAAVQSGGADAAIVYRTDVPRDASLVVALAIPVSETPGVDYHAAALRAARQPEEAARFLAFLSGTTGQAILARHGFLLSPSAPPTR